MSGGGPSGGPSGDSSGDSIRLRTVFFGTSGFAEAVFRRLHAVHEIAAAVTRPPRPAGRGHRPRPSRIREAADELGVPVLEPKGLRRPAAVEAVTRLRADCLVVADYGRILPPALLDSTPLGAVNVHASLLPSLRGAAPAVWAVARGLDRTGVTTMLMDEGLDTGPILLRRAADIRPDETGGSLLARLAPLGADLLVETLAGLAEMQIEPLPQDEAAATEAPPVRKTDAAVDWRLDAVEVERRIRAFQPAPVAFTAFPGVDGSLELLRIHVAQVGLESEPFEAPPGTLRRTGPRGDPGLEVACGGGRLLLREVQPTGSRRMTVAEFLRGNRLPGSGTSGSGAGGEARPAGGEARLAAAEEAAALVGPPEAPGETTPATRERAPA